MHFQLSAENLRGHWNSRAEDTALTVYDSIALVKGISTPGNTSWNAGALSRVGTPP